MSPGLLCTCYGEREKYVYVADLHRLISDYEGKLVLLRAPPRRLQLALTIR